MSEPPNSIPAPRKRRRPALSCEQCRRRKIKCDRTYPCGQCLQSKTASCSYSPDTVRDSRHVSDRVSLPAQSSSVASQSPVAIPNRARGFPNGSARDASSAGVSPNAVSHSEATLPSSWTSPSTGHHDEEPPDPKALLDRIERVERELANSTSGPQAFFGCFEGYTAPSLSKGLRGTVSKTRFFGPSHWMYSYGAFDKVALLCMNMETNTPDLPGDLEASAVGRHVKELTDRCKILARSIKAVPYTQWLANPIFREAVPTREMSDNLVTLYLRTQESRYRILHIPSFQKEYEQYWLDHNTANPVFILKLLLVMSIGASFYQGLDGQRYRLEATKWIYAAQAWLSSPFEKGRLHTSAIQLQCLLLIARQHHSIAGDLVWISAGSLLRTALQMGYHRDPKVLPKMTTMQAEIRRRLWATILEINLQSALDSGMPLLISVDDYDTEPPANIDDVDLTESMLDPVTPKPPTTFTQCWAQIALLRVFLIRLEVVRFSNNLYSEPSYDDVLRVGSELSQACKEYDASISRFNKSRAPEAKISQLHRNELDSAIRRFLLLVHRPFGAKGLKDPHYYFSRKVCLDSAVTMLKYPGSEYPPLDERINGIRDDYTQMKTACGGYFKSLMVHAGMIIFTELYTQLEEDATFTEHPTSTRQALKSCVQDIIKLSEDRIAVAENNVKGHLFMSVILAQLTAMEEGTDPERLILEAAQKSADTCWNLLVARTSAAIDVPLPLDNGLVNDLPGLGGVQDFGMDFTMQDWSMDQGNPDALFKSGFEDGVWWYV